MADYRITCVTESRNAGHDGHIRIVGSGTTRWTVTEARAAIDAGHTFHTISPSTGKRAEVRKWTCTHSSCDYKTLKSAADAVTDNNLDNLPPCS